MNPRKITLLLGVIFAALSIVIGAFAAHGLKRILSADALDWIDTGVQYQQFHSLGLILIAVIWQQNPKWAALIWSAGFMALGIVLFSGSLYGLATTQIRTIGILTPIGGLAFIIGWSLLAITAWRGTHDD